MIVKVHWPERLNHRNSGVILYTKSNLTIWAVETVTCESGTCELVLSRLECKWQDIDLIVVGHSEECVSHDFLLSELRF